MLVEFQYADGSFYSSEPQDAHLSPDTRPKHSGWVYVPNEEGHGGVIRMFAVTDDERRTEFVYDDFYYWYQEADGTWIFGSGTPKREYRLLSDHTEAIERPVTLLSDAGVRYGVTLSQEDAVTFGLIESVDAKTLHPKTNIPIEQ